MSSWLVIALFVLAGLACWLTIAAFMALLIGRMIKQADKDDRADAMARKAKHDQKIVPDAGWVCTHCKADRCNQCTDIMRFALNLRPALCKCKRKNHSGEPRDKQIQDPETGAVWGPGLRVTQEGEVLNGGYEA